MRRHPAAIFLDDLMKPAILELRYAAWTVRDLQLMAGYVALYLLLDWASFIQPWEATGITPWNPAPALSFALLLVFGVRFAPALFVATFVAEIVVRGGGGALGPAALTAVVIAGGYSIAALVVASRLQVVGHLRGVRDLAWLMGVVAAAAAVIGILCVGIHVWRGIVHWSNFPGVLLHFWIGDVVGILVNLPLILVLVDSAGRRKLGALLHGWEPAIQIGLVLAILWAVFLYLPGGHVKYFYLMFLPLTWIAARHGLAGASMGLAAVQVGLIVVVELREPSIVTVLELQGRMLALSITCLLLGVVVDERQRAQESLAQSLRLAAAGEMAAALAHEVNQPLSALVTYAKSCQLMLDQTSGQQQQLVDTVNKVTQQAQRVGAIVRRLRDFLRSGTMNLEPVSVSDLVQALRCAFARQAESAGIEFKALIAPGLPTLWIDRLEVEIVLRNLLANAVDSIRGADCAQREIRVEAARHSTGFVRLSVFDSGPGVSPHMREQLFTPFCTSKSHGMGLGLAVSRAIIEAHGGRLWADNTAFGAFHLTLPTNQGNADADNSQT